MAPTNTKLCENCGKAFATTYSLNRHRTSAHSQARVVCPVCDKPYRRREDLNRHVDTVHRGIRREYPCEGCGKVFTHGGNRSVHQQFHCRSLHQQPGARGPPSGVTPPQPGGAVEARPGPSVDVERQPQPGPSHFDETLAVNRLEANPPEPSRMDDDGAVAANRLDANALFRRVETAFRNRLHTFSLRELPSRSHTLPEFLNEVSTATARLLDDALADQRLFSLKTNLFVECEFSNVAGERCVRAFKTKNIVVTPEGVGTERLFEDMARKLVSEMETCQMVGSGWAFARVLDLQVRVNRYVPLRGSHYIPLPEDIERTRSTVNDCDRDDRCFVYTILAPDVPANPDRPTSYTEAIRTAPDFPIDASTFSNVLAKSTYSSPWPGTTNSIGESTSVNDDIGLYCTHLTLSMLVCMVGNGNKYNSDLTHSHD